MGYWAWFMGLHIGGTWLPVRVLRRSERRLGPTERSVLLNWAATFACDALLLGIFCPPWGQAGPEEVVRVYPAWLAVRGLWYVMEAQRFWGPGPTRHRFSRIPSPCRISSRKPGSSAAAKRFRAMLSLDG